MSFLSELVEFGVTFASFTSSLIIVGSLLWLTPLILYSLGLNHSITTSNSNIVTSIWITDIVIHVIVGILVTFDAWALSGQTWPIQTLIIGAATFVTFTLPVLASYYTVNDDTFGTTIALASLGTSCVANATMVSILFELFHRGIKKIDTKKNTGKLKTRNNIVNGV